MHFLTFVVIEREGLTQEFDIDQHDIETEVSDILEPYHNQKFDYYDIGGRWGGLFPDNRMTVANFISKYRDFSEIDCYLYFDYQGESWDVDEHIGLISLMGWQYDAPEYQDIQTRIKKRMYEALTRCKLDDLIVIVDIHQ